MLGALADQRQSAAVKVRLSGQRRQGQTRCILQRGGGGQPGPLRHVTDNREVGARQLKPCFQQAIGDAADIVAPRRGAFRRNRLSQREGGGCPAEVARNNPHLPVIPPPRRNHGLARDRTWQHEAVVIVGMFADQVYTARRARDQFGPVLEAFAKQLVQGVDHWPCR